jgi:hypothetical protein
MVAGAMAVVLASGAYGASEVGAQEMDLRQSRSGRGFFQAGYLGLDVDDVNAALAGAGFPTLDRGTVTLGGGGYATRGRFVIGGEGHGILSQDQPAVDGSVQIGLDGGYGLFKVGYLAYSEDGFDVYPTVGIGGGGLSLSIVERSAPTFDDILEDPARSSRLSTGMFLLDLGVSGDYRFMKRVDEDGGGGGLLVGFQAGYVFAPGSSDWRLDDINGVAGGPDLGVQGFYIRLSLGGWGGGGSDDDDDGG